MNTRREEKIGSYICHSDSAEPLELSYQFTAMLEMYLFEHQNHLVYLGRSGEGLIVMWKEYAMYYCRYLTHTRKRREIHLKSGSKCEVEGRPPVVGGQTSTRTLDAANWVRPWDHSLGSDKMKGDQNCLCEALLNSYRTLATSADASGFLDVINLIYSFLRYLKVTH